MGIVIALLIGIILAACVVIWAMFRIASFNAEMQANILQSRLDAERNRVAAEIHKGYAGVFLQQQTRLFEKMIEQDNALSNPKYAIPVPSPTDMLPLQTHTTHPHTHTHTDTRTENTPIEVRGRMSAKWNEWQLSHRPLEYVKMKSPEGLEYQTVFPTDKNRKTFWGTKGEGELAGGSVFAAKCVNPKCKNVVVSDSYQTRFCAAKCKNDYHNENTI